MFFNNVCEFVVDTVFHRWMEEVKYPEVPQSYTLGAPSSDIKIEVKEEVEDGLKPETVFAGGNSQASDDGGGDGMSEEWDEDWANYLIVKKRLTKSNVESTDLVSYTNSIGIGFL